MTASILLLALLGSPHFTVTAAYQPPARAGADGAIAVSFAALDPDVRVNLEPAPRLRLEPAQRVLLDKQKPAPSTVPVFDPDTARYVDAGKPVTFPVALAPGAPKGTQAVKASLVFFYCSKRESWCRRGSDEIEVLVSVP